MGDNGERLDAMLAGIDEALETRRAEVGNIEGQVAELEPECTGREWWRDKNHPEKEAKLYVNHSIGQFCPLHGEPKTKGRLRVYVGSDSGRIADARAAMVREVTRQKLEQRLVMLRRGLNNCEYLMARFYDHLGYDVRIDGGEITSRW